MTYEKRAQKFHTDDTVQPIRSSTLILVVTRHQCGIPAVVYEMSFCGESSDGIAKCGLFSEAGNRVVGCQPYDLHLLMFLLLFIKLSRGINQNQNLITWNLMLLWVWTADCLTEHQKHNIKSARVKIAFLIWWPLIEKLSKGKELVLAIRRIPASSLRRRVLPSG